MKTLIYGVLGASLALFNTTLQAADAVLEGDDIYCYGGATVRAEGGRSGEKADVVIQPGGDCGGNNGKTYITGDTSVKGTLYAKRVQIQSSVPWYDYVLDNDYKLRPLDELEAYIKENNHLPDIPPAAEFEQNGYDMVEIDGSLMKKVEELTLYIIQQEKRIRELESRLND